MSGRRYIPAHVKANTDAERRAAFRAIADHPGLTAAERGDIAEALGLTPTHHITQEKP